MVSAHAAHITRALAHLAGIVAGSRSTTTSGVEHPTTSDLDDTDIHSLLLCQRQADSLPVSHLPCVRATRGTRA